MAEKACLAAHNMIRFNHGVSFKNRYRLGTGTIRNNARVSLWYSIYSVFSFRLSGACPMAYWQWVYEDQIIIIIKKWAVCFDLHEFVVAYFVFESFQFVFSSLFDQFRQTLVYLTKFQFCSKIYISNQDVPKVAFSVHKFLKIFQWHYSSKI